MVNDLNYICIQCKYVYVFICVCLCVCVSPSGLYYVIHDFFFEVSKKFFLKVSLS